MSQSLYRKYRPQFFREVVGQQHVTQGLLNAVREDRVGHAYLFSGPRGTGKTSMARLLAKALNCLAAPDDGEPCGTCDNCVGVAEGKFPDLIELDAASNNGVDAMRDLVEKVHFGLSVHGRRKVYVVDEVHMLSVGASNALLKTLEEPPEHVVFVLATTDPHKVLATIRSRTQHFEFNLLSSDELHGLLVHVLELEGIAADDEAIDVVVRRAAGSARDAESILDQALAVGRNGGKLDTASVIAAFGGTGFDQRVAVLDCIASDDPAGALVALHESLMRGIDPRELAEELLRTLRDTFMQAAGGGRVPHDGTKEEAERLVELATKAGLARLTRGIETLGDSIADMRGQGAPDPRLLLEVAVVRLARRDASSDTDALVERLDRLEARVADLARQPSVAPEAVSKGGGRPAIGAYARAETVAPSAANPTGESDAPAEPVKAKALVFDDVVIAWKDTLASLGRVTSAMVQHSQPIGIEDNVVIFGVPADQLTAVKQRFKSSADEIRAELERHLGARVRFKVVEHDFSAPGALLPLEGETQAAPGDLVEHEEQVDVASLVDAPDAPPFVDTAELLMTELGAQVVEERPRGE